MAKDEQDTENLDDDFDEDEAELMSLKSIELLCDIIESAERDNATGELIISAATASGINFVERFQSIEDLREFLGELGWEIERGPHSPSYFTIDAFGYGGTRSVQWTDVDQALEQTNAEELFTTPEPSGTRLFRVQPGLLVPEVKIQLSEINEELIKYLAAHPTSLYSLDSRRFEELVGELFRDLGYEVIITPRSRDGGVDIRAIHKNSVGTLLYLVECKRYRPDRPVGVEIVRSLYGVLAAEQASCGVLATTSYFTAGAKEFAQSLRYQLSLRDYNDLTAWLCQYPTAAKRR